MKQKVGADQVATTTPVPSPSPVSNLNKNFIYGVQGGAYALNQLGEDYHPENVDIQIAKTKELGVGLIRANLEIKTQNSPFNISYVDATNDDYINKVSASGLDILLVLDPDIPNSIGKADYYNEGYKMGTYAAKRYKGKVKYFQLANELSGTIIKPEKYDGPTFDGENGIKYSTERYQASLEWIKGMAKGIRENDPSAKLVVSGHWILYDIFGKLINDGADFDILGWSFYSSDGDDITKREFNYGDHMNLAEKLAQYKKDLWIVEANRTHGSYEPGKPAQEQDQANYLDRLLTNIYSSDYFKGFIFFSLFDNPIATDQGSPQEAQWGLVKVNSLKDKSISNKSAFQIYKDFIAAHS